MHREKGTQNPSSWSSQLPPSLISPAHWAPLPSKPRALTHEIQMVRLAWPLAFKVCMVTRGTGKGQTTQHLRLRTLALGCVGTGNIWAEGSGSAT